MTNSSVPYFFREKSRGDNVREPIFNARELQILNENNSLVTTTPRRTISNIPKISFHAMTTCWRNTGWRLLTTQRRWLIGGAENNSKISTLRKLKPCFLNCFRLRSKCIVFGIRYWEEKTTYYRLHDSKAIKTTKVQHECDYIDREDEHSIPTANVVSAVHIDTDVGAYDSFEGFLVIVETNEIKQRRDQDAKPFDRKQYQKEILRNKKRFAVVPIVLHLSRPLLSRYFRPDTRKVTITLLIT